MNNLRLLILLLAAYEYIHSCSYGYQSDYTDVIKHHAFTVVNFFNNFSRPQQETFNVKRVATAVGNEKYLCIPEANTWREEIKDWLQIYQPLKEFDKYLCTKLLRSQMALKYAYECSGDDTSFSVESFYDKKHSHGETCRIDQTFITNGDNDLIGFAYWTPLQVNYSSKCYKAGSHPQVPEIHVFFKPSYLPNKLTIQSVIAKLKYHTQFIQSNSPSLIDKLYESEYPSDQTPLNNDCLLPQSTTFVYRSRTFLWWQLIKKTQRKNQQLAQEFLKTPGFAYESYNVHKVEKEHFEDFQRSIDNSLFYHDYISTLTNNANYKYFLISDSKSNVGGAIIDPTNEGDFWKLVITKKENEFRVFDNYSYNWADGINRYMLWNLDVHISSIFKDACRTFPATEDTISTLLRIMH